jgi:hypothetical protein
MSSTTRKLRRTITRQRLAMALRASGCICSYNVVHTGPGSIRVEHDDFCPMINYGRQLIIDLSPPRCER